MRRFYSIHVILIVFIDLCLIIRMIQIAWKGNDKAIMLVLLAYPLLTLLHAIVWLILSIFNRPEHRIYKVVTLALIVLFIPVLMLAGKH